MVTGIVNFFLPDHLYWIDTIWYCNLVHILAGTLGLLVVWKKSPILARRFNLALGMIYLYEVVANFAGLFPARITNWSSVDDMVYLFTGMLLILCGIHGQKKTAIIFTSHTQVS
ncbi:MAG: DUF4383 domain-containing protein [Bacteroidetes bacterium]|nr:MAG: DUF4383 domain-containing protein [Bacteroidota bacterium]